MQMIDKFIKYAVVYFIIGWIVGTIDKIMRADKAYKDGYAEHKRETESRIRRDE